MPEDAPKRSIGWTSRGGRHRNYPERPKIEQMIVQARQHANIKPGEKASKSAM